MNTEYNLHDFFKKYHKIIIPDIQRDYVMGSNKKKLEELFKAMIDKKIHNEVFNFSCIMGSKQANKFCIYDGQQRLVTLVFLCAYLYSVQDTENPEIVDILGRFSFNDRNEANSYLRELLNKKGNTSIKVVDFTTYSIKNLLEVFNIYKDKLTLNFMFKEIKFEVVKVKDATDAEQFFMDLNDGLPLETYEVFKAQLNHEVNKKLPSEEAKKFILALDNKWLNFFYQFKTSNTCEEEIEICFIKYCFRMMHIEDIGGDTEYSSDSIKWISNEHLHKLFDIVNNLINHFEKVNIENIEEVNCINYSYGELSYNKNIQEVTGVYWNLEDHNYLGMLKELITNICNTEMVNNDVLVWCYISNLDKATTQLNEYLRFIKILLNNNRTVNRRVFYDENKPNSYKMNYPLNWHRKERIIFFTKYSTYAIPTYYAIHSGQTMLAYKYATSIAKAFYAISENKNYLFEVIVLNGILDGTVDVDVIETIRSKYVYINKILLQEVYKRSSEDYLQIEKIENLSYFNGLVNNILDDNYKIIASSKKEFQKFIGKNNSIQRVRAFLNNIFGQLSGYSKALDILLYKNLYVLWIRYDGKEKVEEAGAQVLPQSLCDFFTDPKFINIIRHYFIQQEWIYSNLNSYLYLYEFLPVSWLNERGDVVYPTDHYTYSYERGTDVYKGISNWLTIIPYAEIFEYFFYEITVNTENNDLLFAYKNKEPKSFWYLVESDNRKWLLEEVLPDKKEVLYIRNVNNHKFVQKILKAYLQNGGNQSLIEGALKGDYSAITIDFLGYILFMEQEVYKQITI